MAGQAHDLVHQEAECAPAGAVGAVRQARRLGAVVPAVGHARHPLNLALWQRQRLAQVADGSAHAVGGEGGHQRGVVVAVAALDLEDQALADVAREVEVDVGDAGLIARQEPADEQLRRHRVDVGEADQVADDRADAGAAAAAGGQQAAGGALAAHLEGDVAGQLEDVAVQEEEAGQAVVVDQGQLLVQAAAGLVQVMAAGVAELELVAADAVEGLGGRLAGVGDEVGVAVAEVAGEVEAAAVGHLEGAADGVVGEAGGHLGGGAQDGLAVAAAVALAGVEGGVEADRDQGVLQEGAAGVVGVDVAGGDGAQAQLGGQLGQPAVAAGVAAPVGALQLDRESVAAEDAAQPAGGGVGLAGAVGGDLACNQAVAGAAGQAVQAVGVDGQLVEGDGGGAAVVGVARVSRRQRLR